MAGLGAWGHRNCVLTMGCLESDSLPGLQKQVLEFLGRRSWDGQEERVGEESRHTQSS